MVYGRSSNGRSFAADLDVVGHEMTHGVTDHFGGLIYLQQSGAINEAVSDYSGNAVDVTGSGTPMDAPTAGLLGEDLCPVTAPEECALRDMTDGRSADRDYLPLPPDVDEMSERRIDPAAIPSAAHAHPGASYGHCPSSHGTRASTSIPAARGRTRGRATLPRGLGGAAGSEPTPGAVERRPVDGQRDRVP
ncbi:M4 family metallopeptidase [Streptomyces sp. NPDC055103]